ncbi:flagella biosynthesis chaperone for FliD, FliT [Shewanella sp. Isolate11]|uniref:flagella biosynthesis chaperone for FliD, FliT n=1 Tax=Shewanella sp. Isolate11 TaxID=2908530 RepID=UPI001EFD37C8|nr:flagella biosynthesis chaperone for FliD, FliT [Shewanella sp. Isolate11]MCG9697158.1 flagella biosynthesis chaperone for FliD, FliT [Shewanella sp. Isolate11]
MQNIIEQLADVNNNILLVLEKIDKLIPDDEESALLVSELQTFIDQRETCLQALVIDDEFTDADFLLKQQHLTQQIMTQASKVMAECQTRIQGNKNTNRQISAYKAIESNR